MHGPCGPELHFCPEYDFPIRLVDDVVQTLYWRKRDKWRRARDKALALWTLDFAVEEGPGARYTYFDPADPYAQYLTPFAVPGAIRILRQAQPEGAYRYRSNFATVINNGGVAVITPKRPTHPLYEWYRVICHEVGHCLGLEHGGKGVMDGDLVPNTHDLDSVRNYYS